MSQGMKNESGKSKKNVMFGKCPLGGGMDNIKRYHFHRTHLGKIYILHELAKIAKDFFSVSLCTQY